MRGSEELRKMAFTELNLATKNERKSWLGHPCSRALRHELEGDYIDLMEGWANGNFATETVDGTIQLNSEALGKITALSQILVWVEGIADEEMFDDQA